MSLKAKLRVCRTTGAILRVLGLFLLLCAFRHEAKADPVTAITAGVGGVGSLLGGILGSGAAKSAAGTQAQAEYNIEQLLQNATGFGQAQINSGVQGAQQGIGSALQGAQGALQTGTQNANQTLSDIFQQEYGNLNPYLQAGQQGITSLQQAVAPGGALAGTFQAPTAAEAQATPGYQFTLDQGSQAIMRNAAANGLSGGSLKALDQYGQGLASTYYQQAYNNALTGFNTNRNAALQNIQTQLGLGQYGTSQFQSAAQNYGNQAGANYMNSGLQQGANMLNAAQYAGNAGLTGAQQIAGLGMQGAQGEANAVAGAANAQAAGTVGSANAWNSAIGGITNAAQYAGAMNTLQNYGAPAASPFSTTPYASATPYLPQTIQPSQPNFSLPGFLNPAPVAPPYNASAYSGAY